MDKIKMQQMILDFYKRVFSINWGETWYSSTIRALISSAIENEALYEKEEKDKIYYLVKKLHEDFWEPYQLIIETQIGLVLILCQTYITKVVSQVDLFYRDYEFAFDREPKRIDGSKRSLLSNYGSKVHGTAYRSIEVLDALANYFKHHEEWAGKRSLSGVEKRTAEIVSCIGGNLNQALWYSRNLSKCIKKLGINSMKDLFALPKIVDEWKIDVGKAIAELE